MEDLRKCWKVPYIVYYCSLLEQTLDLIDLRIDEFEEAIIDDSGNERNIIILHLLQKLLKPFVNKTIDLTNFESSLLSVLRKYNEENLFLNNNETNNWNNLTILNKIDIIHLLCELRLQLSDIEAKFNNLDPNCLRIEPIGIDSNENKLWYFGDLRLYEEKCANKLEKKLLENALQSKKSSKGNKKKKSGRRGYNKNSYEDGDDGENENDLEYIFNLLKEEKVEWQCVCVTLDDWYDFTSKYKKSRKKQDLDLYKILEENYLNEMPSMFHKAEKERQQRLMALAPKRTSQRLEIKRQTTHTNYAHNSSLTDDDSKDVENDSNMINKLKKEELSKQREERLKLREMRKDLNNNTSDQNSQSSISDLSNLQPTNCDFNARNYLLMNKIIKKILSSKYAWPFKTAVTEADAPDYKTIVQNPIDLSKIQLKINNKFYKSRSAFGEDLQLIVSNCLLYNGVDSFYGKIALKFETYYKRWLQIIYPREISNSFEEKNRLLLKLNSSTSTSAAVAAAAAIEDENDSLLDDTNTNISNANQTAIDNDESQLNGNENDGDSLADPEFITKRTSSGRLVKMKISTDYDYASDQDENGNKKRKSKYYADDEFVASSNGNKYYRKYNDDADEDDENSNDSETSFSEERKVSTRGRRKKQRLKSLDNDDEDNNFSVDKVDEMSDGDYSINGDDLTFGYRKTPKPRGRKPKLRSIDELVNSDDNTSSTNDGSLNTLKVSKKLTFEQYVKILTGNQTNTDSNGTKTIAPTTTSNSTTSTTTSVLTSTAAANASKLIKNINVDKLKVPIINPIVAAVLEANKLKQQQQQQQQLATPPQSQIITQIDSDTSPPNMINIDNLTKSVKIIAMPQNSATILTTPKSNILSTNNTINTNTNIVNSNNLNKKVYIVNSNLAQPSPTTTPTPILTTVTNSPTTVLTNTNSNLIKILNVTQQSQPQAQQQQQQIVNTNSPINTIKIIPTTIVRSPIITPVTSTINAKVVDIANFVNKNNNNNNLNSNSPNRHIILINSQQNVNNATKLQTQQQQQPVQILTKISGNNNTNTNTITPTQLIKITTTSQNNQPNIQTITKIVPSSPSTTTTTNSNSLLP